MEVDFRKTKVTGGSLKGRKVPTRKVNSCGKRGNLLLLIVNNGRTPVSG